MSTSFANRTPPVPVDELLNARGAVQQAEGFIVGCAIARDSSRMAFATGDGIVHVAPRGGQAEHWRRLEVHDGGALALAQDVSPQGFLTGGDDNRLCRIDADDAVHELARGRRWVEHVATVVDGRTALIATAVGKQVELRDADGILARTLDHDSTVSGVVFDARGKRIATSHYGGATLRFVNTKTDAPRVLAWKGSHIGIAMHPNGDALVTAMQENELHGWRLPDGHNMRMSGYPQKTQSFAFSRSGRWLATSGADVIVLWPFFGGGPMGKPPLELAGIQGVVCTRVAFHPQHDIVAAGFIDGTVLMADVATKKVLPVCGPHGGEGQAAVTALAYSPDGGCLAFGTEGGRMAVVNLSPKQ